MLIPNVYKSLSNASHHPCSPVPHPLTFEKGSIEISLYSANAERNEFSEPKKWTKEIDQCVETVTGGTWLALCSRCLLRPVLQKIMWGAQEIGDMSLERAFFKLAVERPEPIVDCRCPDLQIYTPLPASEGA